MRRRDTGVGQFGRGLEGVWLLEEEPSVSVGAGVRKGPVGLVGIWFLGVAKFKTRSRERQA